MAWWKRLPFFYGWVIVAVTFVCFAVGYATWHSFSIFYVALLEEFGWSRAETALAFSIFTIAYGFNSPIAGSLVDRFGPRTVLPLGALLVGSGLLAVTQISSLWGFYLLYGVVAAIGVSLFGSVVTFVVLNNWFVRKRGTAGGLATAGIGVGTLVMVPLLQFIIISHGWRAAYTVLAVATLVTIPTLVILFQRRRPQDMGLLPDGDDPKGGAGARKARAATAGALVVDKEWASREWDLRSAMRTRRFWLVSAARGLELLSLQMFLTHQAAFFVDAGFDKMVAASVVGTVGIVGSVGKIMWGVVSDRVGRELAYTMAFVCGTLGIVLMLNVTGQSSIWMAYGYGIIYGLCYGASAVLTPVLAADLFHGKSYGAILGGIYVVGGLGSSFGAWLGGYVFDLTGSYTWAFSMGIPAMWFSCLFFWLSGPRKVRLVAGRAPKDGSGLVPAES